MPTPTRTVCPICKIENQNVRESDYGQRLSLECPRCGNFTITKTASAMAESRELGPKLSAWIRERTESGAEIPEINSNTLNKVEAALPAYKVSEKQLLLLRALERRTEFAGDPVVVTPEFDYPLAWAANEKEFRYLLRTLIERDLLKDTGPPSHYSPSSCQVEITAPGWSFLDEHARPSVISDQVFVAMSFSEELKPAWEKGIKLALKDAQFRAYRVDMDPHIDRIDTKIISEIKNSRFLVADFTKRRPGVYFEAGYALALGLPVFWCVRNDELDEVHFDTRQFNHIIWKNEQDLREQLYRFVDAIVGKGSPGKS